MATVRANCPDCGDVEFTTRDIEVSEASKSYRFVCPKCGDEVTKPANQRTIDLLLASGCNTADNSLLRILQEHTHITGEPIGEADVEAFTHKLTRVTDDVFWDELIDQW